MLLLQFDADLSLGYLRPASNMNTIWRLRRTLSLLLIAGENRPRTVFHLANMLAAKKQNIKEK